MKIGILGSGDVGLKLADSFTATGHTVKIGTRSPEKVASWVAKHNGKASAGSFSDAASFGEIVVLATLWEGTPSALQLAGTKNFQARLSSTLQIHLIFQRAYRQSWLWVIQIPAAKLCSAYCLTPGLSRRSI
jgi:hypothetical protein